MKVCTFSRERAHTFFVCPPPFPLDCQPTKRRMFVYVKCEKNLYLRLLYSPLLRAPPELCAYGLFCGLLLRFIRTGRTTADLYLTLVPAMVLGRVVGGAARAMFALYNAESYSLALWVGAYVVETLPGAILQLVFLPALVLVLTRAKLIPARYGADGKALEPV